MELKDITAALDPLGEKITAVGAEMKSVREDQDQIRGEVKKIEEWLADAEAKFEKARRGESVADNLKAAIPDRHRHIAEVFARTGSKDPVKDAAAEVFLKNHLKLQMPAYQRQTAQLVEENERIGKAMGEEKAYLNENTTGQGSYAVPTIVEAELFRVIENNSMVRQVARKLPMNSKTSNLVTLASNVTAYVIAEVGGAITAGEPTINKVDLTAKDFVAYGQATLDVLADEVVGLLNFFMVNAGEMIGQKEDYLALEGTSGDAFSGLIAQTATNTYTIGKIFYQATTTATNAPTISPAYIAKGVYGPTHKGTRISSAWFMAPITWANVLSTSSSSLPVFGPGALLTMPAPYAPLSDGQLLGYPVYCTNQISTALTEGAKIYFGAFGKGMVFGDRSGVDFMISEHEKLQYGLVSMRVIKRTGIAIPNPEAFSITAKTPIA